MGNKLKKTSEPPKMRALHTTFKQAFVIKKNPYPWGKALSAGLAASLPVLIGLLLGNLEYGILAGIGGFSYLYVFNQPYAQRAKKIFFVWIGMALSVALGTLMAPYPLATALVMGLIGAIVIFIFGALKIAGPSALFIVLSFALATGMPVDPSLAFTRGFLVFLGGALSWVICMLGWFVNPHGPEQQAVTRVYRELAGFLDSIGTDGFKKARHRTITALKEADQMLAAGYSNKMSSDVFKRLYLLNEHAHTIFLGALELSLKNVHLPPELGQSVNALADSLDKNTENKAKILQPEQVDKEVEDLFIEVYNADAIMNEPDFKIHQEVQLTKPSLKTIFLGAFDKNSIVLLTALRFGSVVAVAAIIAYSADFNRSYWVPLSCAAVMSGPTVIATFHRAVQRMAGTIIGLLIASVILTSVHNGYVIAFIILCLTFITELFIVRNYGLAAIFFTPSALVIAEYTTKVYDFNYFASVRATDILVGSLIGLLGAMLFGSRSASGLLTHFIAKTIRSQGQLLVRLFSENNDQIKFKESRERRKMHTNVRNLLTVYNTALGELFTNKASLEAMGPVIFSIEQLEYYLEASLKYDKRPVLAEEELAYLLYVFEMMALKAEQDSPLTDYKIPEIEGFTKIRNEILELHEALKGWKYRKTREL